MRIVFATDGSSCAKQAARFLDDISFARKPELTLLTVTYDPQKSRHHRAEPWVSEWRESQRNFVEELHADLEHQFAGRCASMSKVHLHGNAAHQILNHASKIDADLIVMGAIGHSMIGRMFLGSVSDNVATHAKCSVLVIRPLMDDAAADASIHKIIVAYDGSHAADEAIAEMSEVQWNPNSEIKVITVFQEPDYLLAGGVSANVIKNEEQFFERMRKTCEDATDRVAQRFPHAQSKTVKGHHIGDTIVRTAADNDSDLIIVGDAGHNLVEELIVGTTAKFVLRHAARSVWISRHHRS